MPEFSLEEDAGLLVLRRALPSIRWKHMERVYRVYFPGSTRTWKDLSGRYSTKLLKGEDKRKLVRAVDFWLAEGYTHPDQKKAVKKFRRCWKLVHTEDDLEKLPPIVVRPRPPLPLLAPDSPPPPMPASQDPLQELGSIPDGRVFPGPAAPPVPPPHPATFLPQAQGHQPAELSRSSRPLRPRRVSSGSGSTR